MKFEPGALVHSKISRKNSTNSIQQPPLNSRALLFLVHSFFRLRSSAKKRNNRASAEREKLDFRSPADRRKSRTYVHIRAHSSRKLIAVYLRAGLKSPFKRRGSKLPRLCAAICFLLLLHRLSYTFAPFISVALATSLTFFLAFSPASARNCAHTPSRIPLVPPARLIYAPTLHYGIKGARDSAPFGPSQIKAAVLSLPFNYRLPREDSTSCRSLNEQRLCRGDGKKGGEVPAIHIRAGGSGARLIGFVQFIGITCCRGAGLGLYGLVGRIFLA